MLLHLLEKQGCDHFKAFRSWSFEFPSPEDVPAPSKTVDLITKIILHNFWAKSGWAHSRKKAVGRLARVRTFDLLQIQLFLLSDIVTSLNLSVCKFRGFQKLVMSCVLMK
jgi:hypothetical protein